MREDLTGRRYGRLIVISRAAYKKYNQSVWLCKCDCGSETTATTGQLNSGNKKSCGCLRLEYLERARMCRKPCKPRKTKEGRYPKGVIPNGKGFEARIHLHGKTKYLGTFGNISDAVTARKAAEEKYFDKEIKE